MFRLFTGAALAGALVAGSLAPASAQYYGNGGVAPQGSYQASCTNVVMRGSMLRATCTAANGQAVRSSLNVRSCNGNDVVNSNGNLTCGSQRYVNGYHHYGHHYGNYNGNGNGNYNYRNYSSYNSGYLPQGSYTQSCVNVRMSGDQLAASCTAPNGNRVYSTLNLRRCVNSNNIWNNNGYLSC